MDPAAMERPEMSRETAGAAPETDSRTQVPSEAEAKEPAAETAGTAPKTLKAKESAEEMTGTAPEAKGPVQKIAGNVPEVRKGETGGTENE